MAISKSGKRLMLEDVEVFLGIQTTLPPSQPCIFAFLWGFPRNGKPHDALSIPKFLQD
jgi:hypothetical protein